MAAYVPHRVFWQLPSCFMLDASQPDKVRNQPALEPLYSHLALSLDGLLVSTQQLRYFSTLPTKYARQH